MGGHMNHELRVPAAQYLRMSTEHQQYSLESQSIAIQVYAESHGFEIIQTYSDAAKSGLVLKYRDGLRQLLQDVVSRTATYRAILVYDVSRWGRFQDTDESAHYEFLCKSAGVPVHYCAEQFANDGSLPSLIMKALKRTMAGEYSRELGAKVYAGQKRLTLLGFKAGGVPGYGLRRMLVSSSGGAKQELALRERKSIATDRVILVPGPPDEVQVVREIYRMHISERLSFSNIARILTKRGIALPGKTRWDYYTVRSILTNQKYAGFAVYGRISKRLHTPLRRVPQTEWVMRAEAFQPIVDFVTFEEAQKGYRGRSFKRTDQELLGDLSAFLRSKGRLSWNLIKESREICTPRTYCKRFGTLREAFKLIGYSDPGRFDRADTRLRTMALRKQLISQTLEVFPGQVSIVKPGPNRRVRLRLPSNIIVAVLLVRSQLLWKNARRWVIEPVPSERRLTTLLARLDETNHSILDLHLLPNMENCGQCQKKFLTKTQLNRGKKLADISQLLDAAVQLRKLKRISRLRLDC